MPLRMLKSTVIIRRQQWLEKCDTTDDQPIEDDVKMFAAPYANFPVLESHIHPYFAIIDAGQKIRKYVRLTRFPDPFSSLIVSALSIYNFWMDVTLPTSFRDNASPMQSGAKIRHRGLESSNKASGHVSVIDTLHRHSNPAASDLDRISALNPDGNISPHITQSNSTIPDMPNPQAISSWVSEFNKRAQEGDFDFETNPNDGRLVPPTSELVRPLPEDRDEGDLDSEKVLSDASGIGFQSRFGTRELGRFSSPT